MSYEPLEARGIPASVLNRGTDDEVHCYGYCSTTLRTVRFVIVAALTLGFSLLVFYWKPAWGIKFRKRACIIGDADTLILKNVYGELCVVSVVVQHVSRSFPREYCYTVHDGTHPESPTLPSSRRSSVGSSFVDDTSPLTKNEGFIFKFFIHHHIKYYWDKTKNCFERLRGYDSHIPCNDLLEKFKGQSVEQQMEKLQLYGKNAIDIEVKSYFRLFVEEVMNPFYVFQIFSIVLWFVDDYMYFAGCILLITSVSMAISLYEIRRQSKTLHNMVSSANAVNVNILRSSGEEVEVQSSELVPGDVIVIPPFGCIMSCDAVMVSGSCIVNESMLTGESVPVMKTQLPIQEDHDLYDPDEYKRHTVFCGTQVIQTRFYGNNQVKAVVVRTGFSTAKGELVRSILFPRPMGFKFYRDAMRFVCLLFIIAFLGNIYATYVYVVGHFPVKKMIIRLLDIITIVVPPSLPAAMTVGSVYAQNRLKKHGIFCISPPRINICGKLKLFCFDKTGTLTEEGLDLWGIVPVESGSFSKITSNTEPLDQFSPLVAAMATCHSLTMIDGELRGDPLDFKMFEATSWVIEEPGEDTTRYDKLCPVVVYPSNAPTPSVFPFGGADLGFELVKDDLATGMEVQDLQTVLPPLPLLFTKELLISEELTMKTDVQVPYEIGIVRQFTFSSNLQRMSVITRTLGKVNMDLYAKGAPEKIISLCLPETVPLNFTDRLEAYAVQGFRVIALAWRPLDSKITWHQAQRIKRDDVEQQLTFLGLLVMQNTLKPETTPVIHTLKNANIRTVMATGDNMHTAISVARECGMIGPSDKALILTAHSPEVDRPARIELEYAERGSGLTGSASVHSNGQRSSDGSVNIEIATANYHLCMSGRTFATIRQYFPHLVQKIVVRGTVFARMSPEQKAHLIKELQEIGYIVGMCGDGANDCGALKMADVGISLSEAEASVAAPFTSKIPNIECVPIAIKEGRCALVTSFGVFKYMALYSMIQFISVLVLYTYKTNLGDQQFLYIDLALATIMAIVMGYTKPYEHLVKQRPQGSLVSPPVVFSILCQVLLCAAFQIGGIFFLRKQGWYVPTSPDYSDEFQACWEANVIFSLSSFQYVITAAVFATGPPFRQPFYRNVWMVLSLIIFTAFNVLLMEYPFSWLESFFQLAPASTPEQQTFRLWLLSFPSVNFILSVVVEMFASSNIMKRLSRTVRRKTHPKNPYKLLEKELEVNGGLSNIEDSLYSTSSSSGY